MPFLTVRHTISVVPVLLRCMDVRCSGVGCSGDHGWGYRARCAPCYLWRGARRQTFALADADGRAHIRAKGQRA